MSAKFDASAFLSETVAALRSGEKAISKLLKLPAENLAAVADAATARAAKPAGYADVRLLLARVSWHAGEMRKRGEAPTHVLRSRTSKGVTTVYVAEYAYNENKATKTAAATAAQPSRSVTVATGPTSAAPAADPAAPDAETVIAALRAELARVTAERDAALSDVATLRGELDTARAMLASVNAKPSRKGSRAAATA